MQKHLKQLTIIGVTTALSFLLFGCGSNQTDSTMDQLNAKLTKHLDLVDQKNDLIKDRMASLENDNREMRETLDRILANQENPGDITNQVAEILEMQVDSLIADQLAAKIGDDPAAALSSEGIRNEILAYEEDKRKQAEEERAQRDAERQAEREQRNQERMTAMADDLGINDEQLEQIKVAQATMQKSMTQMWTDMREGKIEGGRDGIRKNFEGMREAHQTIVSNFLSEEQAEAYMEKYSRGNMFGGGGPGGGPGGDRGGRGGRGGGRAMNWVPFAILAAGIFSMLGGALNWDFFMNSTKASIIASVFGRSGARIFYVVLGLMLSVAGLYLIMTGMPATA